MAVLFEGINVIVKKDSIKIKYPGGLKQFKNDIPNLTETEDSKLIRVGFMEAIDAETYTSFLESNGLTYKDSDGNSVDIIIGDQLLGLCAPCN